MLFSQRDLTPLGRTERTSCCSSGASLNRGLQNPDALRHTTNGPTVCILIADIRNNKECILIKIARDEGWGLAWWLREARFSDALALLLSIFLKTLLASLQSSWAIGRFFET